MSRQPVPDSPPDESKHVNIILPVRILTFLSEEKQRRKRHNGGGGAYGVIITDIIDWWRNDPPWTKRVQRKKHLSRP